MSDSESGESLLELVMTSPQPLTGASHVTEAPSSHGHQVGICLSELGVLDVLPHAVSEVGGQVLDLQPGLLKVDVDPVLESVGLDLDPFLFPASNVHRLGGVTLGRPRCEAGPVSLRHASCVHRHDASVTWLSRVTCLLSCHS